MHADMDAHALGRVLTSIYSASSVQFDSVLSFNESMRPGVPSQDAEHVQKGVARSRLELEHVLAGCVHKS